MLNFNSSIIVDWLGINCANGDHTEFIWYLLNGHLCTPYVLHHYLVVVNEPVRSLAEMWAGVSSPGW